MQLQKAIDYLQKFQDKLTEKKEGYMQDDVISVTVDYGDYMQIILRDKKLSKEREKDEKDT